MGRLIDADILIAELKESALHHCNNPREDSLLKRDRVIVRAQPTVEAIPKADIQKALKEGSIDIGKNVLAIVREEYIPKADYENRLKADLVAMLTEIQLEIEEIDSRAGYDRNGMPTISTDYVRIIKVNEIIQQKINKLKRGW